MRCYNTTLSTSDVSNHLIKWDPSMTEVLLLDKHVWPKVAFPVWWARGSTPEWVGRQAAPERPGSDRVHVLLPSTGDSSSAIRELLTCSWCSSSKPSVIGRKKTNEQAEKKKKKPKSFVESFTAHLRSRPFCPDSSDAWEAEDTPVSALHLLLTKMESGQVLIFLLLSDCTHQSFYITGESISNKK